MTTSIVKYEGLGNDFIVLETDAPSALRPDWVRSICDRRFGVGADGVLTVGYSGDRPFMRVFNADGSTAEMCGNGIRCVALHLARRSVAQREGSVPAAGSGGPAFEIDTEAGPHLCQVSWLHATPDAGVGGRGSGSMRHAAVEVEMAVPRLEPAEVPVRSDGAEPWIDAPFEVAGRTLRVTALSLGNPHLVSFDPVGEARYDLGPRIAQDARLPEGANVGFAQIGEDGGIDLVVLERGAGWTQACGTGACAAAVAAVRTGRARAERWIEVRLPGGSLEIQVGSETAPVRMRGPARHVFDGQWLDE